MATSPVITPDMTPQQRAAVYVERLSAVPVAQRTAQQSAELTKYQSVAAIGGNPATGTSGGAATSIGGQWSGLPAPNTGYMSNMAYQPTSQNLVQLTNQVVSQYGSNSPQAVALTAQEVAASVSQGVSSATNEGDAAALAKYRSQWQSLPPVVQALAGGTPAQAVAAAASWTPAQTTAIGQVVLTPSQIGATQVPAGGNASSLIPSATTTSGVTPQGSGTTTSTAVTDTGTGGMTSGASGVTGAGGAYYGSSDTSTGTTTGGMTTADMILIGIGALGLVLALKGRKHVAA